MYDCLKDKKIDDYLCVQVKMLTNKSLCEIGFTQQKASTIMFKLSRLNVPIHKVRLHSQISRNGSNYDHVRLVRGFVLSEAIVALNSEVAKGGKHSESWRDVLDVLIESGGGR